MLSWRKIWGLLRLRCPVCWQAPMFRHPLAMHAHCPKCAYRYDKGNGYFLGAMYASYSLTLFLGIVLIGVLLATGALGLRFPPSQADLVAYAAVALFLVAIGPALAFPYSRAIWVWAEREGWLHDGEEDPARLRHSQQQRQQQRNQVESRDSTEV